MAWNGWLCGSLRRVSLCLVVALVVDYAYAEEGVTSWKLFMRDPVEVGHIQKFEVPSVEGDSEAATRVIEMKTLAIKPPVFEISNLLSDDECDHLIELGKESGLKTSATVTHDYDDKYGVYQADGVTLSFNDTQWNETFKEYDFDGDGLIDYEEAQKCIPGLKGTDRILTLDQIQQMYFDLFMDADSNRYLDLKEFWVMHNRSDMEVKVKEWLAKLDAGEFKDSDKKKGRERISDQAWLTWFKSEDKVLRELPNRLTRLTGLDRQIIEASEKIQVVRYYPGGRYNAHYDSSDVDPAKDCIHSKMVLEKVRHTHPKGRICRYMTIMYYLSDVEKGGETAFPLADNQTYNVEVYNKHAANLTDLSNHCYTANTFVKPKKGKAVMWYNHDLDPESGWLGPKHVYSLHGGCDVIKGVKWIANNWITVDDIQSRQMEYQERYFPSSPPAPKTEL